VTAAKKTGSEGLTAASLGYAEDFVEMPEKLRAARDNALVLGAPTLSPGACQALTFLSKALNARSVVAVGADPGVAGLALFAGMDPQGILTVIGAESDWQNDARGAFTAEGIATNRFRLIAGTPLDVLPKLRDGAYDLVFVNGDKLEYVEYLAQAIRLLRHGGVVILNDALWHNLVADENNEDDETVIIREALTSVLETEEFTPLLIPLGNGLLTAVKD